MIATLNTVQQKMNMYERYRRDIVDRLVRKFEKDIDNTNHMVLGIFTEIGELEDCFESNDGIDWINATEELGDLIFYIVGYSILRDIPLIITESSKTYNLKNIRSTAKDLADLSKKKLAYDREYNREKECELVQKLFDQSLNLMDMGVQFSSVIAMDRVYKKLIVRYENGFNTQAANNRNLEAERAALENTTSLQSVCGCEGEQKAYCICQSGR
jgi:NTP pyrophosphatase (non-canonical NTP hydrolase)